MAETLEQFLTRVNTISASLNENILVKTARESWEKGLDNTEMSTEERDIRLAAYNEQVSLGLVAQATALAINFPASQADLDLKFEQTQLYASQLLTEAEKLKSFQAETEAKNAEKLTHIAALKKNYGYKDATGIALGASSDDGLVDTQIAGFAKDMAYKAGKMFSEQTGMLAQAEQVPAPWMVDVMKIAVEIMTAGKIDIAKDGETTTVTYNGEAAAPNGVS